jgi:MFS family permease
VFQTCVFQTCVFAALFLAPFAGGLIIDHMGYQAAFIISGTGRIVSTLLFLFAVRPASKTPTAKVMEPVRAEVAPAESAAP